MWGIGEAPLVQWLRYRVKEASGKKKGQCITYHRIHVLTRGMARWVMFRYLFASG